MSDKKLSPAELSQMFDEMSIGMIDEFDPEPATAKPATAKPPTSKSATVKLKSWGGGSLLPSAAKPLTVKPPTVKKSWEGGTLLPSAAAGGAAAAPKESLGVWAKPNYSPVHSAADDLDFLTGVFSSGEGVVFSEGDQTKKPKGAPQATPVSAAAAPPEYAKMPVHSQGTPTGKFINFEDVKNNKKYKVTIFKNTTMKDVKAELATLTGIPIDKIRLSFNNGPGSNLIHGAIYNDYKVYDTKVYQLKGIVGNKTTNPVYILNIAGGGAPKSKVVELFFVDTGDSLNFPIYTGCDMDHITTNARQFLSSKGIKGDIQFLYKGKDLFTERHELMPGMSEENMIFEISKKNVPIVVKVQEKGVQAKGVQAKGEKSVRVKLKPFSK